MKTLRVLIHSNAESHTVWRLALRIEREVSQARICGIVQRPSPSSCDISTPKGGWLRSVASWLGEGLLRWVHATPPNLNGPTQFTDNSLTVECRRADWPLLILEDSGGMDVLDFVRRQDPDLVLFIGAQPADPALLAIPHRGSVRMYATKLGSGSIDTFPAQETICEDGRGVRIVVESIGDGTVTSPIAAVEIPAETFDTPVGLALKTILIGNDLLVQAVAHLAAGTPAQAAVETTAWIHKMYPRYFRPAREMQASESPSETPAWRTRPSWKLFLHSLLLFSPYIVVRNWYRRWSGRFPVVILFHHLVSDRPHRMGLPTEVFLRELQFLQRHYRVVPLAEAVELLRSGQVKSPTVALTFDDGYEDNFVSLRAVAEEINIPVTLFISTLPVEEQQEFQHDRRNGRMGFLPLNWDQIRYWHENGAGIGSHTRSHFNCGSSDLAALEMEIVGSKRDLEARLGKPIPFFAFPWGKAENMSVAAIRLAASTYSCSFSTLGGENFPVGSDASGLLGRKGLVADSWELELSLQSVFELAYRIRGAARLRQKKAMSDFS